MTKTFYFQVEKENGQYVLIDKKGQKYKCPTDSSHLKSVAVNTDRSLRVVTENGTITKVGTATVERIANSDNVADEFTPLASASIPEGTTEEHATFLKFLHEEAINKKPAKLMMTDLKWKFLLRNVIRGKNIMMTGAAGCGKTFATQQVGKVFPDRQFFYFNLGATQDPRSTLIGNTHFNKDSGTYFAESEFIKAIQQPNAIIQLDELSRAHPEAMNILMTPLDYGQRYLRIDEADGSPTIKVAEGVSFIATANIGSEYTATRVLDRALLDRFTIVEMDLLNKDQEKFLLKLVEPTLDAQAVKAIAEIAVTTREEMKSDAPKLSTIISTRATLEMASLMVDGFNLQEAAEVVIYPMYDSAGGIDSERTFINQVVQKYVVIEKEDIYNTDGDEAEATEDNSSNLTNKKPF